MDRLDRSFLTMPTIEEQRPTAKKANNNPWANRGFIICAASGIVAKNTTTNNPNGERTSDRIPNKGAGLDEVLGIIKNSLVKKRFRL